MKRSSVGITLGVALAATAVGFVMRARHLPVLAPVESQEPPTPSVARLEQTPEGNVALELGAFRFLVTATNGGIVNEGGLVRIEGPRGLVAEGVEVGARVGDEVATLDIEGVRASGNGVPRVDLEATVSTSGGVAHGVLRYIGTARPASLTVSWLPEGGDADVPVELTARVRGLAGTLFVPGRGIVEDGVAEGSFGAAMSPAGAIVMSGGRFGHYADTSDIEGLFGPSFALIFGLGGDVLEAAYRSVEVPSERLHGRTEPRTAQTLVLGLGEGGQVAGAAYTSEKGELDMAVPRGTALRLFASLEGSRTSGVIVPPADHRGELVVPLAPMGRLAVHVTDYDTREDLPARIIVHGVGGTREPNFGPHHRATGAGPLVDADAGVFSTLLPVGRYAISATRGIEYSVDQGEFEVRRGEVTQVPLALRHVIDTPHWAGCDFHVHARLSFDSVVTLEDRIRSLASAGVDFAVPSEHNHIGNYEASQVVGLADRLAWVPAVEITTAAPVRGHFNAFPFSARPPRFRHADLGEIIRYVRRESPTSVIQINHPRMAKGIGYFDVIHLDTKSLHGIERLPKGFDTIEVYNGFDLTKREQVERVLGDWLRLYESGRYAVWATGSSDSHTVQYNWAGYPRTYVAVEEDHEGGHGPSVDAVSLIASLHAGHAFVTSGPLLEVTQGDKGPGDPLVVEKGAARIHVRVRAAPWVDATEIEVLVGGVSVMRRAIAPRPIEVGAPHGDLDDARRKAVRFDEDLEVPIDPSARTLVVLVRGDTATGDVLPFMSFLPLAFTNPMLLKKPLAAAAVEPAHAR